jgi:glycerophosphoryl diester phosphodiesterase
MLQVRNYTIDGLNVTGVLTVDLTLAELKTVRMRERIPTRSQAFNDFLPVMTFEECATLAKVSHGSQLAYSHTRSC